jgi:hypothetical protein
VGERTVEYAQLVDEFRCCSTESLCAVREEAVREQRRWRLRELAATLVLDERGRVDDSLAATDGVSVRDVRESCETARALEQLPAIADAAARGELSDDQLVAVTRLADPETDREWAQRASGCSPDDLRREYRCQQKPTPADGAKRRAARSLRYWWEPEAGMLAGCFRLPDVDGALFEGLCNRMIDRMRPAKGERWETRERRGADALMDLVRNYADVEAVSGPQIGFSVLIPPDGPATIAGIPLPDAMVEHLRSEARIEPTVLDHDGMLVTSGRATSVVSGRDLRAVRLRDGKCRWPGCDRRTGLQVHHLWPRSWGGDDRRHNLACVCTGGGTDHHAQLAPQGPYLLLGNPNDPHGLHLVHRDDLPGLAQLAEHTTNDARAGPDAA